MTALGVPPWAAVTWCTNATSTLCRIITSSPVLGDCCNNYMHAYARVLFVTPCSYSMGLISEALRAEVAAMRQRHEETDRRVLQLIADARELIAETENMLAEERPE